MVLAFHVVFGAYGFWLPNDPRGSWSGYEDERPLWAEKSWKVFLETPSDVQRAIKYVEANPAKEGKRPQRWSFVTPFV